MKKHVTIHNQETLYYLEMGDSKLPTLILIHGNMSSSVHYLPLMERLKDSYHLIAVDLRGFGDSSYQNPIETIDAFVDDLKSFIDTLNLTKVHLCGWSAGGTVVMRFAARYSEQVDRMILIASGSYKGFPIYKKDSAFTPIIGEQYQSKAEMANDPVQVLPISTALQQQNSALMKQIWQMAIYNVQTPSEESFDLYISETMKQQNLIDVDWALMQFNMSHEYNGVKHGDGSIEKVICPVLALYGAKDLAVTKTMFDETVDALKNVTAHVFENAGHSPITDVPDELSKVIHDFLTN